MSQKTTFQRSAKGPLAISQTEPTGLWVEVENTGRKDESIGGWRISRKVRKKDITVLNEYNNKLFSQEVKFI